MGRTCSLPRATTAQIDHLLEVPEALARFLDFEGGAAPQTRVVRPKGLGGRLLRLFAITITETAPWSAASTPRAEMRAFIDRAAEAGDGVVVHVG